MNSDEILDLKRKIAELQSLLLKKDSEISFYRQQLFMVSQKIDLLMSQSADDLKLLTQVQKVLTPTEIPKIPGFEISRKFLYGSKTGGDYFDIFEHDDKMKFGILVASSSGYAMSALLLSLILKSSHATLIKKGTSPDLVLQQIAEEIKKTADSGDATSVFYGIVDRRDLKFQFCSAGRMDAFYLSKNRSIHVLKSTNSQLDKQFAEILNMATLELEPKSRICIISEGLSEVLGEAEIVRLISENSKNGVHDLRNELLFQAQRISKLEEPLRDQSVLVIDVKDRVIKLAK